MLQRIVSFIFRRRHYWRYVSFDEIAELYVSRLIMVFALNIVGLFMALYLYKLGYSVLFIVLLYAVMYAFKVLFAFVAAKYIAYFGPKHGVLMANILRVPSMIAMFLVPQYGLPAVVIFSVLQNMAACLYNVSYLIDFSKVRHTEHTGKELGTMQLIERFARVVSPIIGGALATVFGPGVVIIIAMGLFLVSSIPLLKTMELTVVRSKIKIESFPWRLTRGSFVAEATMGFDIVVSGTIWVLFTAIAVFSALGSGIYAVLGMLFSVGVLASMVTAWLFGKIVDRRQGDILFMAGVIVNSFIHAFRAFASTPASVVGVNVANEVGTAAYSLPWTRGVFNIADMSGHRILYFAILQAWNDIGSVVACLSAAVFICLFGLIPGMQLFFVFAAMVELVMVVGRRYTK